MKDRPQGRRNTESRENEREQNRKSGKWQAADRRRTEDRYQIASLSAVRAVDLGAGGKEFRARQLYQWMHEKHVSSLDAMGNLPGSLKQKIRKTCVFTVLEQMTCQVSAQDGTRKYLFGLADGNMVESVLMRYHHGNSVCISTQAGCRMGCRFCASTLDGLVRNLTPAEKLEQIYRISDDTGERVSNVVLMGTGEPLDNYENVLTF